jgi:hypothetical protein
MNYFNIGVYLFNFSIRDYILQPNPTAYNFILHNTKIIFTLLLMSLIHGNLSQYETIWKF